MTITEKAAYLKGLAEGLELDTTTKEGKLINALLDMVGALAEKVDELEGDIAELTEYVEELDEDLGDVEELLYDDEDEDAEYCDGDCDGCDGCDDYDMDETFEIECPKCGDTVCFDESVDPESLICPACGEKLNVRGDE
ncbi:MAG: hypothetical protein IJY22_02285 [Clostridia bacterium]|nr:hypothetical protein [Clostridia bacterium]